MIKQDILLKYLRYMVYLNWKGIAFIVTDVRGRRIYKCVGFLNKKDFRIGYICASGANGCLLLWVCVQGLQCVCVQYSLLLVCVYE